VKQTHLTHLTHDSESMTKSDREFEFLSHFFDRHHCLKSTQHAEHDKSDLYNRVFCESNDTLQH
jgi:hypothetical protein